MKEVLDDNFKSLTDQEKQKIALEIQALEEKNWYGLGLIFLVMALICIYTLINFLIFSSSISFLVANGWWLGVHAICLYLSQHNRLIAFGGALFSFVLGFTLTIVLTRFLFWGHVFIATAIIGSYIIFIYDELALNRLKAKLRESI